MFAFFRKLFRMGADKNAPLSNAAKAARMFASRGVLCTRAGRGFGNRKTWAELKAAEWDSNYARRVH